MEALDLDVFFQSDSSSEKDDDDGDDRLRSIPHRTVDEILLLNDSDSSPSSSPSPASSPSSSNRSQHHFFSDTKPPPSSSQEKIPSRVRDGHDDYDSSPKSLPLDGTQMNITSQTLTRFSHSQLDDRPIIQSKFPSVSRIKSNEFSSTTGRGLLPPLLIGGVRSNAKPGAALAAAEAASRSIPSPHAAAIKSRRSTAVTMHNDLYNEGQESGGSRNGGVSEFSISDGSADGGGLGLTSSGISQFVDNFQFAQVTASKVDFSGESSVGRGIAESTSTDAAAEVFPIQDMPTEEVERVSKENDAGDNNWEEVVVGSHVEPNLTCFLNSEDEHTVDKSYTTSVSDGVNDKNALDSSADANADANPALIDATESTVEGISSFPKFDNGGKVEEVLTSVASKALEQEDIIPRATDGDASFTGDDTSSRGDVPDLAKKIILQRESERRGERMEKKSSSAMKPLDLAEELEKKQASTGLHWEEGAAAQPMRLEGVRRDSTVLGYFDIDIDNTVTRTLSSQAFRRDHGSPLVLAVHLNFIAVGMSKGAIVIFPSKYSPHYVDKMDAKMLILGLQGDRSHAPVTSTCFNQQGDLLFAGYGDGHVTIWDVQRASVVKVITGEHKAPVVHMLYLGQDSQVTRQFTIITGDNTGVVKSIRFSMIPWLNKISTFRATTLLDEKTSTVVCATPLLSGECYGGASMLSQGNAAVSSSGIGGMVGGDASQKFFEGSSLVEEGVVIFVTHQSALVAKVSPTVQVYAQIPKPDGVWEGSMPYTAWKCMVQPHDSSTGDTSEKVSEKISLLAIAWDRKVQVAKFMKSELKMYSKWTIDGSSIGVAWLDDEMLVVLTSTGQLCLFAKDGTMIHQTSFSVDGSQGDDLIAYHTHFTSTSGNPEKAYHNCVAVRGANIYILGPMHLMVSRLLPWKERIEVLRKAGDWMGALNMVMNLYDGQAHGVIDLPRHLDDTQNAVMPYLVELLLLYVDEVFSYISVAFFNQIGRLDQLNDSTSRSSFMHSEIKEQFTHVGGVAVELCVHVKRTDILFDEILSKFVSVQQRETFLELLEPYILKDVLEFLPPEIMQALVEHYSMKGWLQRVEQCVLHMDISSLDFNQVVRLCREHRLYGALIYLFNKGLDDFKAPLEELLVVLRHGQTENVAVLGYRMLVYLKYCFLGLAFPPGHGTLPSIRLPSLRTELLQFLLEDSNAPDSRFTCLSFTGAYTNLYHLLELDTEATLDVLRCAFVEDENLKLEDHSHLSTSNAEPMKGHVVEKQNLVQEIVNVLAVIVMGDNQIDRSASTSSNDVRSVGSWPSKKDMGHIYEFIAYYVSCERANVSKDILSQILEYLTLDSSLPHSIPTQNVETLKRWQKRVLALLEVVPETDWDACHLLDLCEKAQFYQVCGLIHCLRHQYLAALDSYMKDVDEPIHAFSYIHDTLLRLTGEESDTFRAAIISRIPDLVKLSREGTLFLVVDHFGRENQQILSELHSHPESLFLYLKTVIEVHSTGTFNLSHVRKGEDADFPSGRRAKDRSNRIKDFMERISDFPKFLRSNPVDVTDEMIEIYFEMLCRYERNLVLKFLETFESYRVEHCLRLCLEYGIIDAAAFLLERVGDVGTALVLTLSRLNNKFAMLDSAVESVLADTSVDHFNTFLKKKEVNDILDVVHACIGLCQRNSSRLDPDESVSLWFQLLDSFCEPLIDSSTGESCSGDKEYIGILVESLGRQHKEKVCETKWKISKSHKGAHILRKLFSMFIKEIVEGMVGHVRLPTIMLKLLSDNRSQEFGDFKLTILGMLGTYDFERRILDTAKSLIEDDTFYTMNLLKKEASHGYAPRSLLCCICNCLLTKNSSGPGIRVFNCGHTTHLQCELQDDEVPYKGSSAGCPICMPKKKPQRSRSRSLLADNGLMSRSLPNSHLAHGIGTSHPHESDAFENTYSSHPIPRFEILTNLQKDQRSIQIENVPQLRLAPPAVYHEKVKKGSDILAGESGSSLGKIEKTNKRNQIKELRMKGSAIRLPLKSNIFGKEKSSKR